MVGRCQRFAGAGGEDVHGASGNIFRQRPLCVQVRVNGRFTDDLAAQLVIRNAAGDTVYQRSGEFD